jgi:hypothetical protein
MKSVVLGNPHADHWKLSLDGVSRREQVVAIAGELHAGFFVADTPMCLPPEALQVFTSELEALYKSLSGSATLRNANCQSEVDCVLNAEATGHINISGIFAINRNSLSFSFRTDQTYLPPVMRWLRSVLNAYNRDEDA